MVAGSSETIMVISKRMTSRANTMAAMGALKMADMAAAAAKPSTATISLLLSLNIWVIINPQAAPVTTVEPSNPTEPPKPTVRALVTMDEKVLCFGMIPCSFEMAYNTLGIPSRTGLRSTNLIKIRVARIPMAGKPCKVHGHNLFLICNLVIDANVHNRLFYNLVCL